MSSACSHVFGPVPSRRLGHSLGIDLVPFKTCPFDCVYCQLGRTTRRTVRRRRFVPVDGVLAQVRDRLRKPGRVDYVTLSGSGEPTLHAGIGDVIRRLRDLTSRPVAVLTNSALLHLGTVRRDLATADLVIPSLDAATEPVFRRVNRPHPSLRLSTIVDGLRRFRDTFAGQFWLEVLLVRELNDGDGELDRLAALTGAIAPDRLQLNTVTRPPAEAGVLPVEPARLAAIAGRLGAEVIAGHVEPGDTPRAAVDVAALLSRRPCTLDDLVAATGLHPADLTKRLGVLLDAGQLSQRRVGERLYYAVAAGPNHEGANHA